METAGLLLKPERRHLRINSCKWGKKKQKTTEVKWRNDFQQPEEGGGLELRSDNCRHLAKQTVEFWSEMNRFHVRKKRKVEAQKTKLPLEVKTVIS